MMLDGRVPKEEHLSASVTFDTHSVDDPVDDKVSEGIRGHLIGPIRQLADVEVSIMVCLSNPLLSTTRSDDPDASDSD
jgi:hypothetical protein